MSETTTPDVATLVRGVNPILPVQDVEEAIAFYRDALGFAETFRYGEPASYAGLAQGPIEIHLSRVDDIAIAAQTQVRIHVENIEPLYEECAARGLIHPNSHLATKPWGTREFGLLDPGGVCITIYEDLPR